MKYFLLGIVCIVLSPSLWGYENNLPSNEWHSTDTYDVVFYTLHIEETDYICNVYVSRKKVLVRLDSRLNKESEYTTSRFNEVCGAFIQKLPNDKRIIKWKKSMQST